MFSFKVFIFRLFSLERYLNENIFHFKLKHFFKKAKSDVLLDLRFHYYFVTKHIYEFHLISPGVSPKCFFFFFGMFTGSTFKCA